MIHGKIPKLPKDKAYLRLSHSRQYFQRFDIKLTRHEMTVFGASGICSSPQPEPESEIYKGRKLKPRRKGQEAHYRETKTMWPLTRGIVESPKFRFLSNMFLLHTITLAHQEQDDVQHHCGGISPHVPMHKGRKKNSEWASSSKHQVYR